MRLDRKVVPGATVARAKGHHSVDNLYQVQANAEESGYMATLTSSEFRVGREG